MEHLIYEEAVESLDWGREGFDGSDLYVFTFSVGGKEDGEIFFPVVPMKGKEAVGTN